MRHFFIQSHFSDHEERDTPKRSSKVGASSQSKYLHPIDELGTLIQAGLTAVQASGSLLDDITELIGSASATDAQQTFATLSTKWAEIGGGYTFVDSATGCPVNVFITNEASGYTVKATVNTVPASTYDVITLDQKGDASFTEYGGELIEDISARAGALRSIINMATEVIETGSSGAQALLESVAVKLQCSSSALSYFETWVGELPTQLNIKSMGGILRRILNGDDVVVDDQTNRVVLDGDRYAVKPALSVAVDGIIQVAGLLVTAIASIVSVAAGLIASAVTSAVNIVVSTAARVKNAKTTPEIDGNSSDTGYVNSLLAGYYNSTSVPAHYALDRVTNMIKCAPGPVVYEAMSSVTDDGYAIEGEVTGLMKLAPFIDPDTFDLRTSFPRPFSLTSAGICANFDSAGKIYPYGPEVFFAPPDVVRTWSADKILKSLMLSLYDIIGRTSLRSNLYKNETEDGWTLTRLTIGDYEVYRTPYFALPSSTLWPNYDQPTWVQINDAVNAIHSGVLGFTIPMVLDAYAPYTKTLFYSGEDSVEIAQAQWVLPGLDFYTNVPYFSDNGVPFIMPPEYDGYNLVGDLLAAGVAVAVAAVAVVAALKVRKKLKIASAKNAAKELQARNALANGTITDDQYLKVARTNRVTQSVSGSLGVNYVGSQQATSAKTDSPDFPSVITKLQSISDGSIDGPSLEGEIQQINTTLQTLNDNAVDTSSFERGIELITNLITGPSI